MKLLKCDACDKLQSSWFSKRQFNIYQELLEWNELEGKTIATNEMDQ